MGVKAACAAYVAGRAPSLWVRCGRRRSVGAEGATAPSAVHAAGSAGPLRLGCGRLAPRGLGAPSLGAPSLRVRCGRRNSVCCRRCVTALSLRVHGGHHRSVGEVSATAPRAGRAVCIAPLLRERCGGHRSESAGGAIALRVRAVQAVSIRTVATYALSLGKRWGRHGSVCAVGPPLRELRARPYCGFARSVSVGGASALRGSGLPVSAAGRRSP